MKRYLAIIVVALSLGGCAGTLPNLVENVLSLPAGVLTTNVQQPITRKMYRNVSNSLILATVGLNIYKGKCERGEIDVSCVAAIEKIQGYTRKAKPVLADLRTFVRKNDQVNARIAYNTVTQLLTDIRNTAASAGMK